MCGLFVLVTALAAVAQKGSFPEIQQLQSPQKPRVGMMVIGVGQDTNQGLKLKVTIDAALRKLIRGTSAELVSKDVSRALEPWTKGAFAVLVLDKKGSLAAATSAKAEKKAAFSAGEMSAASAIGTDQVKVAWTVWQDVEKHAVTVDAAVTTAAKADSKLTLGTIDKFGNMARRVVDGGFVAYVAGDGKVVIESGKK